MIREVDLVSYLPPFMANFKEISVTLEAENPEFRLVWSAADRVLKNEFISTADEYGISRYEKLLHIFPSAEDTLESRRSRVQARWFNAIPYTWRVFLERLISLCGENNFTVEKYFTEEYRVELEVDLELYGQVEELEHLIETMFPANIVFHAANKIPCDIAGDALVAGGICYVEFSRITNDSRETYTVAGTVEIGGGIVDASGYFITNDSRETMKAEGTAVHGGGVVNTASMTISNDFKEQFNINGKGLLASGVVVADFFEIKNDE